MFTIDACPELPEPPLEESELEEVVSELEEGVFEPEEGVAELEGLLTSSSVKPEELVVVVGRTVAAGEDAAATGDSTVPDHAPCRC